MSPDDVQPLLILFEGWVFGVLTCLLYAAISDYCAVKREIREHAAAVSDSDRTEERQ